MISFKSVKGGGVAYVFGKEFAEEASKLFPLISAKILGHEVALPIPESKETGGLKGVKQRVEASTQPQLTLKLEAPVTQPKVLSKQEIADEVVRMARRIEETFNVARRELWYVVYEKFQQKTDINVKNIKKSSKFSRNRSASSYNTLIDDGYGFILLDIVREYHDKLAIR
jgi:hypothetical protein